MKIICQDIKKHHGSREVLALKYAEIEKGSIVGVLGSNGSGKSTFLTILAGLDREFEGDIHYFSDFDPSTQCSMIFQTPYLLHRSVKDNIAYPLQIRGWSSLEISRRTERLLDEFRLTALANQNALTLSGGEQQRLALARSVSFSPSLLLLDEPTSGTDRASTSLIESALKTNHAQGITQVLVTHNVAQAKRLCDSILFFDQGKLEETGKTNQIFSNPKTDFLKSFLDEKRI